MRPADMRQPGRGRRHSAFHIQHERHRTLQLRSLTRVSQIENSERRIHTPRWPHERRTSQPKCNAVQYACTGNVIADALCDECDAGGGVSLCRPPEGAARPSLHPPSTTATPPGGLSACDCSAEPAPQANDIRLALG